MFLTFLSCRQVLYSHSAYMKNDEWVSQNLQRQRQILQEKQRQRRMQNAGVQSSDFGRPPPGRSIVSESIPTRSSSTSFGLRENLARSGNNGNIQAQAKDSIGSWHTLGNSGTSALASAHNSLYSLSNGNSNYDTNKHKKPYKPIHHESTPTIVTIKGFTTPESHNDGEPQKKESLTPQTPMVTVDRLERLNISDTVRLINSESEDENNKASKLISSKRCELWEELDGSKKGYNARNLHISESVSTIHDVVGIQDSDPIPTEIVNEDIPIKVVDIVNNLDQFVMQPTKKNTTLKCKITRDRKGMDKGMFPIYYLHLEKIDGKRVFLLAARRRKKSTTANYLISTDPTDLSRDGRSFIAKIRSNAMGTAFTLYDKGENPKKASVIGEGVRQELAAVIYEPNVLGLRGPRKMIIIIPGIYVDEKTNFVRPLTIRPISEKDTILERHKSHRLDEMVVLNNKQPIWNEESQSYVLNFHGRVTQASVKNFQIVHFMNGESDAVNAVGQASPYLDEYIVMQFGRIDNDNFTMDVRYPLSPVQAFGIAMTSFHKKLACD